MNVDNLKVFEGFIKPESVIKELEEFIVYVKNDLGDDMKKVYPTMLVVAKDEEQAALFARGVAKILKEQKIISTYLNRPSFLWESAIGKEFDCVLVDDFDDRPATKVELERVEKRVKKSAFDERLKLVNIFYTTKERAKQYKEYYKEDFYKYFVTRIELKPYEIQDIIGGAHKCFGKWAEFGEIEVSEDFYPALDEWIDTVYDRADKTGKEFVVGLKERLIKQSKFLGHPYKFDANTIPQYWHRDFVNDVKNEMLKDLTLLWSSDLDDFFALIDKNVLGNVGLDAFNIIISSDHENEAKQLAKYYARLLNSKEYRITSSKYVQTVLMDDLLEIDKLDDLHGVIFVEDFNEFENTNESYASVLMNLKQMSKDSTNDLVFVLYNKVKTSELNSRLDEFGISDTFNFNFNLLNHTKKSSERLISYIFEQKNVKVDDSVLHELAETVLNTKSLSEAIQCIETKFTALNDISEELCSTDEEKFKKIQEKEEELGKAKKKARKDRKERNVLLLPLSTLNSVNVSKYESMIEGVKDQGYYVSQLEPVPKMLAGMLNAQGDQLDSIYVLNTSETENECIKEKLLKKLIPFTNTHKDVDEKGEKYTAFTYFKERCGKFVEPKKIKSISISDGVEQALYEVTNRLKNMLSGQGSAEKINLYVDFHGGFRDSATVLNAILILIKDIDNIELKDMYTIGYDNQAHFGIVRSVKDVSNVYDFVSGMKEFLSFGRSNGLVQFNDNVSNEDGKNITNAINKISDSILLNRMENFTSNLKDLSTALANNGQINGYYGVVKDLVLNNYKVKIENNTYNLLEDDSDYLPAQLQWGLEKKLLQQALVLIESKTAPVLYSNRIISGNPGRKRDYPFFGNWVKFSLCENEAEDVKYLYSERATNQFPKQLRFDFDERDVPDGIDILPNVKYSYYGRYIPYFNNIDVYEDINVVVEKIKELKTDDWDLKKYYVMGNEHGDNRLCVYVKVYDQDSNRYYYKQGTCYKRCASIPVNEVLKSNNNQHLEDLYVLMYIYKCLKKYRNTVAHALRENGESVSREVIEKWIELYIVLLNRFLKNVVPICAEANNRRRNQQNNSRRNRQNNQREN